ncbi:MAG TPA: hypothetical protein VGH44_06315 [Candidatus Saccharimonadia bacterium]
MDVPATPTLAFNDSTSSTAAQSVVDALAAIQRAFTDRFGCSMTPREMVEIVAAASHLSLVDPHQPATPEGFYSPEFPLHFDLAPRLSLHHGSIKVTVPALGPAGPADEATIEMFGAAGAIQAIIILHRVWKELHKFRFRLLAS